MSNIENEVVSITFDNGGFQKGVEEVLASMEDLRGSLDNFDGTGAFKGIEEAAEHIDLSGIDSAINSIDSKFSALGAVAFTAIQDVTTSAVDAARSMFDKTLGQIISGGTSRSLAIEQAKFRFQGLGQDVEASMQSALEAVRGTSYGLDEAATLASAFGGAGITAGQQLTESLRGVAGVASVFGQNFAEIGTIFQDVAAKGTLSGAHLFSFTSRGIGIAQKLAEAWGTTVEEIEQAAANGEITFEEFAGTIYDLFGDQATRANETYSGSLDNIHAAMNRLGEAFIAPRLEATRNVFNTLAPVLDSVKEALLPLVDAWKLFANIQAIKTINFLEGLNTDVLKDLVPDIVRILKNLYSAIGSFTRPIKQAFRDIFPRVTGENLENIALAIKRFTRAMELSGSTMRKVRSIFGGVFAVFSIAFEVIKNVVEVVFDIVKALSPVGSGFLTAGAGVGNFLVSLEKLLVDGGGISDFFDAVTDQILKFIDSMKESEVIQAFGDAISWVGESIADIFGGISSAGSAGGSALDGPFNRIEQRIDDFMAVMSTIGNAIADIWNGIVDVVEPAIEWLADRFSGLGSAIADAMGDGDFDRVLDIINTGLFGGIVALFAKFLRDGATIDLTGGTMEAITGAFEQLTATLEAMQLQLKASALMKIAQAIGILTISIVALSLIDSAKLTKALAAIAAGFAELSAVLFGMTKMGLGTVGGIKPLLALAGTMVVLTIAIGLLSVAVLIFSAMDTKKMIQGLVGVGSALLGLSYVAKGLVKSADEILIASGTIIALAVAVGILGLATAIFARMQWDTMIRGLTGVATGLTGITLAMKFIPADAGAKAPSLLALGFSLIAIAKAVEKMADLSWGEMIKGLIGLGAALAGMVFVANELNVDDLMGAGSIAIMALSMVVLAEALKRVGEIPIGNLIKSILGMAAAMVVLWFAGALFGAASEVIIPGAAAIAVMAGALYILAIAMDRLGSIDFATFGKALLFMAGGLLAIAIASVLLLPAVIPIALLGAALLIFGAGLALVGAGIFLAAKGFEVFAKSGSEGISNVMEILKELAGLIPMLAQELAKGILEFFQVIVDAAPGLVEGLSELLGTLFTAIAERAPEYGEALKSLVQTGLDVLTELYPDLIQAGVDLIVALLEGIANNVGPICDAARNLVFSLYGCIIENATYLPRAAFRLVMNFTQGIRSRIGSVVSAGASMVQSFIRIVISSAANLISSGANAVLKFITGIGQKVGAVLTKGRELVGGLIRTIASNAQSLLSTGAQAIGNFILGISSGAITLLGKGIEIAGNLIDGLVSGIGAGLSRIIGAVRDLADRAVDAAKSFFGIDSPSKRFREIGEFVIDGFVIGIENNTRAIRSVEMFGDDVVNAMTKTANDMANAFYSADISNPTITPILDLTTIQSQAKDVSDILGSNPVRATTSFDRAADISALTQPTDQSTDSSDAGPRQVIFEQTINATQPLSAGEVYRQTKSQIVMAKEELEVA